MFLFKLRESEIDLSGDEWIAALPRPVAGHPVPKAGERAFVWTHEAGLIGECVISGRPASDPSLAALVPVAVYAHAILGADWLSGADRNKDTLRSKLHCLRTSRTWHLSDDEVIELDQARRNATPHP